MELLMKDMLHFVVVSIIDKDDETNLLDSIASDMNHTFIYIVGNERSS
jgi:hypothetical protein